MYAYGVFSCVGAGKGVFVFPAASDHKRNEALKLNYEESLHFILDTPNPGAVWERNVMEALLAKLGDPQNDVPHYVHVAGTNGKGSASAFMASVLRKAGYRTGLYTSPFIQRFNERIQVDGVQIPDEALAEITTEIAEATEVIMAEGFRRPTIFELITALGFTWFSRSKCDFVVLEVGMGGRLDATNVIRTPDVAMIMNIGFDHMEFLGDTLEAIAGEKAGIIKRGGDVVVYGQSESVERVFEDACRERGCRMFLADSSLANITSVGVEGTRFDYKDRRDLFISLLGKYQIGNVTVAIEACDVLRDKGFRITEENLRDGLRDAYWPGRMELLRKEPVVIVDGAHNPQGVEALCESLEQLFPGEKYTFVLGVLADKDYSGDIAIAAPHAKKFYTVTPPSYRALSGDALAEEIKKHADVPVTACAAIPEALDTVLAEASPDDRIVVFGSLYQECEVRAYFGRDTF